MRFFNLLKMISPPFIINSLNELISKINVIIAKKKLVGQKKLHLACGGNILDKWANIDFKTCDVVIGLNLTKPLPVRSGTIELVFSEHFIEHVSFIEAKRLLAECFRVMQPNGILRLSTPCLKKIIDEYLLGRTSEWCELGWNPETPCQMVNEGLRLWGHQFVYDFSELKWILEDAGFEEVKQVIWHESTTPALRKLECRPFHGDIILEAIKNPHK